MILAERSLNAVMLHSGPLASQLPLLVTGSYLLITSQGWGQRGITRAIQSALPGACLGIVDSVPPNPSISYVLAHHNPAIVADFIIALGGGSVMDAAKAFAALCGKTASEASFLAMLEKPDGFDLSNPPKIIAIPTTSGTGSEITRWATIWSQQGQKYSLSHPALMPAHALLDSALCLSMPSLVTLTGGLDALSHACEALWNNSHTSESDRYAQLAIRLLVKNLPAALADPGNSTIRENMQQAALYAGYAMSITKTAIAHSISYPLTGEFDIPHGIACSFTLPEVMEFNLASERLELIAQAAGTSRTHLPAWCAAFLKQIGVDDYLKRCHDRFASITSKRLELINPARAGNNIRPVTAQDAQAILQKAIERIQGA
jgi:phosphonate metabolism-associated iron-containing alcohol dehydrogenase